MKILMITFLIIPIMLHEIQRILTTRGRPKGTYVGGSISIFTWFVSYLVLLMTALLGIWKQPATVFTLFGYLLFITAILFRSLSLRGLGKYYSSAINIQKNHIVITTGVYHFLRHPLHLGLCLEISAFLIMAPSLYGFLLVLFSWITLIFRNINEEKLLEQKIGEPYRHYQKSGAWDIIDLFLCLKKIK